MNNDINSHFDYMHAYYVEECFRYLFKWIEKPCHLIRFFQSENCSSKVFDGLVDTISSSNSNPQPTLVLIVISLESYFKIEWKEILPYPYLHIIIVSDDRVQLSQLISTKVSDEQWKHRLFGLRLTISQVQLQDVIHFVFSAMMSMHLRYISTRSVTHDFDIINWISGLDRQILQVSDSRFLFRYFLSQALDLSNFDMAVLYSVDNVAPRRMQLTTLIGIFDQLMNLVDSFCIDATQLSTNYLAYVAGSGNSSLIYGDKPFLHPIYNGVWIKMQLTLPICDESGKVVAILELAQIVKQDDQEFQSNNGLNVGQLFCFNILLDKLYFVFSGLYKKRISDAVMNFSSIGCELVQMNELNRLLYFLLEKSKQIISCDRGSIYMVKTEADGTQKLEIVVTDLIFGGEVFSFPISKTSISGYAALYRKPVKVDDVRQIASELPYSFNSSVDKKMNYYTKSMLTVPLVQSNGKLLGVIQLINKLSYHGIFLTSKGGVEKYAVPFEDYDVSILTSVAAQASLVIEKKNLYDNIEMLLESFVKASIKAIESRDPTTSGHSERVAAYTVRFAKALNGLDSGPYAKFRFTSTQIKEMRYAALLHDFGKIGVPEDILNKHDKLFPHDLKAIIDRFHLIYRTWQYESVHKSLDAFVKEPYEQAVEFYRREKTALKRKLTRLKKQLQQIKIWNCPNPIKDEQTFSGVKSQFLKKLGEQCFENIDGKQEPILKSNEIECLNIGFGSLTNAEREVIKLHVTWSFEYLSKISWTKDFEQVPNIAYGHHERLDGTGYPRKLTKESIPVQAQLIMIVDMFDALIATDRPYKKIFSLEDALALLQENARLERFDSDLVQLFIDAKVYDTCD